MNATRLTPAARAALALQEAAKTGATITVEVDGHAPQTGTLTPHPTLPAGYWRLAPVGRGATLVFHSTDVSEVIFE